MKSQIKRKILEYLPYVFIVLVVVLIRSFLFTPVKVNGDSMYPTLKANELMILNKIALNKGIDRFDIVVIKSEGSFIIKRVIALPGESISYIDGKLYINKKLMEDNYSLSNTDDFNEVYLKDNEYFVMGDNRDISKDSRIIGPVNEEQIIGKANLIFFPFNRIGIVK